MKNLRMWLLTSIVLAIAFLASIPANASVDACTERCLIEWSICYSTCVPDCFPVPTHECADCHRRCDEREWNCEDDCRRDCPWYCGGFCCWTPWLQGGAEEVAAMCEEGMAPAVADFCPPEDPTP